MSRTQSRRVRVTVNQGFGRLAERVLSRPVYTVHRCNTSATHPEGLIPKCIHLFVACIVICLYVFLCLFVSCSSDCTLCSRRRFLSVCLCACLCLLPFLRTTSASALLFVVIAIASYRNPALLSAFFPFSFILFIMSDKSKPAPSRPFPTPSSALLGASAASSLLLLFLVH